MKLDEQFETLVTNVPSFNDFYFYCGVISTATILTVAGYFIILFIIYLFANIFKENSWFDKMLNFLILVFNKLKLKRVFKNVDIFSFIFIVIIIPIMFTISTVTIVLNYGYTYEYAYSQYEYNVQQYNKAVSNIKKLGYNKALEIYKTENYNKSN